MNLVGLIVGIALLIVVGGGYVVMHNKDTAMMDKSAIDAETPAEVVDTAAETKRMMEEKDALAQKMMDESQAQGEMMKKDDTMMQKEDAMMRKGDDAMMKTDAEAGDGATMSKAGAYIPYASEKLAMANSGDVVLFFRASWCPSCKVLDADIKKNASSIPADLTILDVNYDTATDLKKKYGVTYQHTLVQVDAAGNQIAKWSGSPSLADIAAKVQ